MLQNRLGLKGRILLFLLPPTFIALTALSIFSAYRAEEFSVKQSRSMLTEITRKTGFEIDSWMNERTRDLKVLSTDPDVQRLMAEKKIHELNSIFSGYMASSPIYENIFAAEPSGIVVSDGIGGKTINLDLKKVPGADIAVSKLSDGKNFVGHGTRSPVTGDVVVLLTTPIYNKNEISGLLGMPLSIKDFAETFIKSVKVGEEGEVSVFDKNGLSLINKKDDFVLKFNLNDTEAGKKMLNDPEGFIEYNDGVQRVGYFVHAKNGWIVFAALPKSELIAPAESIRNATLLGGFIALILIGCVIYYVATQIYNHLEQMNKKLHQTSKLLQEASTHLSSSSHNLSSGSNIAASSIEETVASLEQLTSMVKSNTKSSNEAATHSKEASAQAKSSESEISHLIQSIHGLADSSKKIKDIIQVIDDIAFQTNLLALNASVEAARAGEHGKGFAVVADAVRSLAQKSADAAKDIAGLINESVTRIEDGKSLADTSSQKLHEIVTSIVGISAITSDIAHAGEEQSAGITQISQAMKQLDDSTQQNAESAERVSAAALELKEQSSQVYKMADELDEYMKGKMSA